MTKVDEHIKASQDMLNGIVERCYELEEENKKLKEENKKLKEERDATEKIDKLLDGAKRTCENIGI